MTKQKRAALKITVLTVPLIAVLLILPLVMRHFAVNQISDTFVKTLESKDISNLQKYVSKDCRLYENDTIAFFEHNNEDTIDTILFNDKYRYENIKYLGAENKLLSSVLVYHVDISGEAVKEGPITYYVFVKLEGATLKILSIEVEI